MGRTNFRIVGEWPWVNINLNPVSLPMGLFQALGLESTESLFVS